MERLTLRPMRPSDARGFEARFTAIGWTKPRSVFERYLAEQAAGTRWTRVAEVDGALAGYVTISWTSRDPVFHDRGIPEIVDLNVLPEHRRKGVGSALLDAAERAVAERHDQVGLGVGLHSGYGSAQRLYVRRGYVPDGAGVVRYGRSVDEGAEIVLDDDPMLRMTKSLRRTSASEYVRELRQALGTRLLLLPAVAIAVHDARCRLLMVLDAATGDWGLPAGGIEPGEDPEAAARRELREETGIELDTLTLEAALGGASFRHTYPNGDRVEYALVLYSGRVTSGTDLGVRGDASEQAFFIRAEAPAIRFPYPEHVLWPERAGSNGRSGR